MPVTEGQGNPIWGHDETILALQLLQNYWPKVPGSRSSQVKELSELIRQLPIPAGARKNQTFRNPDGVYLKLQNLASLHPDNAGRKGLRTSKMDRSVWATYWNEPELVRRLAGQIVKGIDVIASASSDGIDDEAIFEASEGEVLTRVHRIRERKRGFRSRVIQRVEKAHGNIVCEACRQEAMTAGQAGYAMFEAHHLVPLSEAATAVTRLDDLALLCANCHRLIHAVMRQDARHYALADFQKWLNTVMPAT